jgi:hypothetical protein
MDVPEIRYAKSGDLRIAYQVVRSGTTNTCFCIRILLIRAVGMGGGKSACPMIRDGGLIVIDGILGQHPRA